MSARYGSVARPLALVGLRCSGKSTVGRLLAEGMGCPFLDVDEVLAERWCQEIEESGTSAGELLERFGLEAFRGREARLLRELVEGGAPRVLATGGGCVENPSIRELLARSTDCIWLQAEPELLAERLERDPLPRPPLTDSGDPLFEMRALAVRRDPWYRAASRIEVAVGTDTPEEIAARIRAALAGTG